MNNKVKAIFNNFGVIPQLKKQVEENIELIEAIASKDKENIIDELADFTILNVQSEFIAKKIKKDYNISNRELSERIEFKVNRTLERYKIKDPENNLIKGLHKINKFFL